MRRNIWRNILIDLFTMPDVAISNARFMLGMWIGGFASATRLRRDAQGFTVECLGVGDWPGNKELKED